MKFYQLEYFVEVFRCNSISKAAENLFVSQPAISFGIKELEDEFGVKLFKRTGNKITHTEAGAHFYERVVKILDDIHTLGKDMLNMGENNILIKVGTPPMIGTLLFPDIYNRLTEIYPKMKIEILEYGSLQAQNLVLNNEADVAIAILNNIINDNLECHKLFETELVFCVNKHHTLARRRTVTWEEIEEQDLILMKEDSYQNAVIKEHFARNNVKPNIMLYSSQLTTIRNFIVNSNAGAFLFKQIARSDPDMAALSIIDPIRLNIGIIWKKNPRLYNDLHSFISFVKDYVASVLIEEGNPIEN